MKKNFVEEGQMLLIAIIWLTDKHFATKEIEKRMISLMKQMAIHNHE
jgi:ribonuclease P protein component